MALATDMLKTLQTKDVMPLRVTTKDKIVLCALERAPTALSKNLPELPQKTILCRALEQALHIHIVCHGLFD